MKVVAAAITLAVLIAPVAACADPTTDYVKGPWHFKAITCVDTTVTSVTPRLGEANQTHFTAADFKESGVVVTFATGLGLQPLFPNSKASVTHYQDAGPENAIMEAEHVGDRVQVCFLGGPPPTTTCNPDTDERGRTFRVYDYRQKQQYSGMNEEHDCGGA